MVNEIKQNCLLVDCQNIMECTHNPRLNKTSMSHKHIHTANLLRNIKRRKKYIGL